MDSNLILKPIELLDIGIDKLTKMPVPILNENMVSTFDNDNGVPTSTFNFTYDASYGGLTIIISLSAIYPTNITFDFGSGQTETFLVQTGNTSKTHVYTYLRQYTITIYGDLDKISKLYLNGCGGIISANLNNLRKLIILDISGNRLTSLNLGGMIYLQNISVKDNYLYNDDIDDVYATTDLIPYNPLAVAKSLDTTGPNNGTPSSYSTIAISNLTFKGWTLLHN